VAIPDLQTVMLYLGDTSVPEDEVADALAAETAAQQAVVRARYFIEDPEDEDYRAYPDDLAEALKRRVARTLALRNTPLGVIPGDAEGGPATFIPRMDSEIRRFEAPYRRLVVG